jgi:hypothetical protein
MSVLLLSRDVTSDRWKVEQEVLIIFTSSDSPPILFIISVTPVTSPINPEERLRDESRFALLHKERREAAPCHQHATQTPSISAE